MQEDITLDLDEFRPYFNQAYRGHSPVPQPGPAKNDPPVSWPPVISDPPMNGTPQADEQDLLSTTQLPALWQAKDDPLGSWTGSPLADETPTQDADDL